MSEVILMTTGYRPFEEVQTEEWLTGSVRRVGFLACGGRFVVGVSADIPARRDVRFWD